MKKVWLEIVVEFAQRRHLYPSLGRPRLCQSLYWAFSKGAYRRILYGFRRLVWGREFTSKDPELSGQLEIKKHWYNFMLWGRLGYDNALDKAFFVKKIQSHFPQTNAPLLYSTWQEASKIIPQVNVFHWRDWDYMWSVEGCIDERMHFHDIIQFMINPTISGDSILNPIAYAQASLSGKDMTQISPLQVVSNLDRYARNSLAGAEKLQLEAATAELRTLGDDIRSMAHLGLYYARKIEAATELAFYAETQQDSYKEKAITQLEQAAQSWDQYRIISEKNYHPQMLARTKMLDFSEIMGYVKQDIDLAKNFKGL